MDKLRNRTLMVLVLLVFQVVAAQAAFPENFDVGSNYYTAYGGPDLSASLLGVGEYSRGDTVILELNLMNRGLITGFESDRTARTDLEIKLQQTEMNYEAQKTTAIGIMALLISTDPDIRVKSGPQEAGSLAAGQQTEKPVRFTIEISKFAQAGPHPVILNLIYGYQENVQINGKNDTYLGVTDLEVGLWYEVGSQNITLPVKVKEEAAFEVTEVSGELIAGHEGMLHVTYMNTGEKPVRDATVRISVSDPFSTTDDQAFIGELGPGDSGVAKFRIKVDGAATPKQYSLNSQIKYEDVEGHDVISDNIRIMVEVMPRRSMLESSIMYLGIAALLGIAVFGIRKYSKS